MDPNVCPVCTLYLREGITLHSHLNTHPKDQVIEALVRCASLGVPGSITNESSESVSDSLNTAQTTIETPSTSVHHFGNPVQGIPTVPSSGPVSVSSPYGIAGQINLPNTIPSHNAIATPNPAPTPIPSVHPFAIGLGSSSGNQYASTFAYQQFCGGGDGSLGGGPLLLAMSPQQQYAAYSSSSSSSSNSVLQMVFNPYAVDPVIGNTGYSTPGLITGIGLGPTLQTCQQVQTNVLQQVVTASPLVATTIPSVTPEVRSDRDANESTAQVQEEEVANDVQIEQVSRVNGGPMSQNLDAGHPTHNLGNPQNASASSSNQTEKYPFCEEEGASMNRVPYPHLRSNRRGRSRTKQTPKSCQSKQLQAHSAANRSHTSSLRAPSPISPLGHEKEEPRKGLGKNYNVKQFLSEHVTPVYNENGVVIDGIIESCSNHSERSVFERSRKQYQRKQHGDISGVESCLETSPMVGVRMATPLSHMQDEKTQEPKSDEEEWVDISLFPGDTVVTQTEEDEREDPNDNPFQGDGCFQGETVEQAKNASINQPNSQGADIFILNQWNAGTADDRGETEQVINDSDGNEVKECEDERLKEAEENKCESESFPAEQPNCVKDYSNETEGKAECWVQTPEVIAVDESPSVDASRTERHCQQASSAIEDDEVVVVGRGENATLEPEQECQTRIQVDGCGEGSPSGGAVCLRPAPGDTEDALPAPPSPVNIFQIDGMSIILSSRLIEQTDKMRERLGIFEGLGPMAGSFSDISIPEGILEEEGLVSDIRADEAMPPRGELSGQEGMGSGSNYSDTGLVEDPVPKPEGTTIWTSGGFSLFPASARQGVAQSDLLPGSGETWSGVAQYKGTQEDNVAGVVPETTPKKRQRAKKSAGSGGASKTPGDGATKTKTKRLYHCWTCLEVFNCPKERRVHQREKHSGEKGVGITPTVESAVPPVQMGEQGSLAVEVDAAKVKAEMKETKAEPKEVVEMELKERKVAVEIREDGGELENAAAAKCSHACSDCDRSFPSLRSLTAHRRAAHRDSRFKCPTCMEKFLTSADFTNHVRTVHPLECSMCGKQFCRQQNLRLHLKRHLSVRPYKCTQCDKAFVTNQKMEEHLNSHTGRTPFQCPLCPRAFRRHSNLIQHRKHHHMKVKRKVRDFFCHCGAVFHSAKKLDWHKETHEDKPKTCPHCSDRFVHRAGLTRHIRQVHDRRYVPSGAREDVNVECPVCSAVYLKSSLHIHMRVHSGERPFSCGICGKGFATKWNLQLHRWVHASPHSKPFKCATCKAAYHRRVDYVAHIRSHRKVRPYVCNTCGRRFMRKYNCVRHSREHETGKAFECSICHKRFHRRYYLKEHLRIHTGLRPYVCHVCGKASGTKSNMNKHVRIHHAREPVNTEG